MFLGLYGYLKPFADTAERTTTEQASPATEVVGLQTVATIVVASLTCGKDWRVSQSQHTGSRPAPTTPFDYS